MKPKLRFKGFKDVWVNHKLEETVEYTKGYAFKSENYSTSGGRIIRASDLKPNNTVAEEGIYYPMDELRRLSKYKLRQGDIVITTVGSQPHLVESAVGRIHYFNNEIEDYYLNQNMVFVRTKNDIPHKFLSLIFQRYQYAKYIKIIKRGNANQANITVQDLLHYRFHLPQFNEQVKLGNLFNRLDKKISLLTKKKEALETYKKGLMQKIFSQELRFKREDGTDYPEWETYCIADLGEFFNGLTGKNSSHFGHGNSQYVQYSQVFRNSYIKLDECDNVDVEDSDKQNALKVGDALFTTSSEVADEVAFASILLNKPKIDTYLNSFCFGLRLNSLLAPSFAQYLFRTTIFRKAVYPLAQGSTRYNVSKKEVGKVKLLIPSIEEQNHIAKSFRVLDSQIEQIILLKNKTEQLKKGLLQQMFE